MIMQLQIRQMTKEMDVLIPLNKIISYLLIHHSDILNGIWTIRWIDMGVGGPDFEIRGELVEENVIRFIGDDVFAGLISENIYFDHGEFANKDGSLLIGIFDSSFIYVTGEHNLLENISSIFDPSEIKWVKI